MRNVSVVGLLMLLACGGGTEPDSRLAFEGIVTSAATGLPIVGADIELYAGSGLVPATLQRTTTDAQGQYVLSYATCIVPAFIGAGMVGYSGKQLDVTCLAAMQTLNISLTASP